MLNFIRRYQKIFLATITVAVVSSFVFFGTYGAFINTAEKAPDKILGSTVDGSSLTASRLAAMKRFLGSDRYDGALMERGDIPNFFNDGALRSDLLESGFAALLFEGYKEELGEALGGKLKELSRYRPYRHPYSDAVSVEAIWDKLLPSLKTHLVTLRKMEPTTEAFSHFVALYLDQGRLSPSVVRQFLSFEEEQSKGKKDPALAHVDLRINGWSSLTDWFGEDFLDAACQFLLNSALHAKQLGYTIDYDAARSNLLAIGKESLSQQLREEVSKEMVLSAWKQQLATLGLDEKTAVSIWQEVLLFRTWIKEIGDQVVLDTLSHEKFQQFNGEALKVVSYELPADLQLRSVEDIGRFEAYLAAIGGKKGIFPGEVSKKTPELVQRKYRLAVGEVTLEELSLRIPVKQTWKWEGEHLAAVKKAFPELKGALNEAPSDLRDRIDAFARMQIVLTHPEWVDEAFRPVEQEVSFPGTALFKGADLSALVSLLEKAAAGDSKAIAALESYTGDNNHFYRIALIEQLGEEKVLSFSEAKKQGLLDKLVDKHLKALYPTLRASHEEKFKQGEGWKKFDDVKGEVAKIAFSSEGGYRKHHLPWLKKAAQEIASGKEEEWTNENKPGHLIKKERVVTRDDGISPGVFALTEGSVSSVELDADGVLRFYKVVGKCEVPKERIDAAVMHTQRILAAEARQIRLKEWVEKVRKEGVIYFERDH